ncbi:hypothetical protein SEPCBS119000_002560 [Sporothrix epigloea]|uniref:Uncharacterized protein n=1 Tax=Sporothrix epigloea TaxID=1892477 RepID=A0ABP0DGT1_9PEZI
MPVDFEAIKGRLTDVAAVLYGSEIELVLESHMDTLQIYDAPRRFRAKAGKKSDGVHDSSAHAD